MIAATYNIVCEAGANLVFQLTWLESAGTPRDLSGYTGRMLVKRRYEDAAADAVLTLTTENGGITLGGPAGTILVNADDSLTASLTGGWLTAGAPPYQTFYYDLKLTSADSQSTRLLQGKVLVSTEISKAS